MPAEPFDLDLRGARCIVTGASKGIGRETAARLAGEGARVLLVARDPDEVAAVATDLGGEALACDVTAPDADVRVVTAAVARWGGVDVLVNNAGTSWATTLEELTDDDWQRQWELNVMAPMRLMRAAAPLMAAQGAGRIVNVTSSSGKRPTQTNVAYSVTKAAQLSLSRAFADHYAAQGLRINAVAPGPTDTGLWHAPGGMADQRAAAAGIDRDAALDAQRAKIPIGRFATEQEVADVVVFLCSPRAGAVSGAAWSVDGGSVPVII